MSSEHSPPAAMDSKTDATTPAPTLSTEPASDTAKFSLGAHLLGFPAADDCVAPTEQQEEDPGAWLVEFRAKHAGRAVYQGVFRSCPAGRDWVLRNASKATLRLDTSQQHDPQQWQRQLCAVKAGLLTRGTAPTTLVLTTDGTEHSTTTMTSIGTQLQEAGAGVAALRIESQRARQATAPQQHDAGAVAAFLQAAVAALPSLSDFELAAHKECINAAEVAAAMSQYLPQITTLTLEAPGVLWPWRALLTQPTPLTHFNITTILNDTLLSLLVMYAPALTHLTVSDVRLSRDHSKERWGVECLDLDEDSGSLCLASLCRLPASDASVHIICYILETEVSAQGLAPEVRERLSQWRFTSEKLNLKRAFRLADQSLGLSRAIEDLDELEASDDVEMWLSGFWHNKDELAEEFDLHYQPDSRRHITPLCDYLAEQERLKRLQEAQAYRKFESQH